MYLWSTGGGRRQRRSFQTRGKEGEGESSVEMPALLRFAATNEGALVAGEDILSRIREDEREDWSARYSEATVDLQGSLGFWLSALE